MSSPGFRKETRTKIKDLLSYWRKIESWVKKSEQVNKRAVVPAINELRYAGRILLHAVNQFSAHRLTPIDEKHIDIRIAIAEQYLMNADHDLTDAIVTFYGKAITVVDNDIGVSRMSEHYPRYPELRDKIQNSEQVIQEARDSLERRPGLYNGIREDHIRSMIEQYRDFQNGEVLARFSMAQREEAIEEGRRELETERLKNENLRKRNIILAVLSVVLGIASVVLGIVAI